MSTSSKKRLSAHLLSLVRIENLVPRNAILITRYQLLDRRFKLSVGTPLPAFQISDDYTVDSIFAQEALTDYQINEGWAVRSMYLHGKGRNLDLDNGFGLSQSFGYQLG